MQRKKRIVNMAELIRWRIVEMCCASAAQALGNEAEIQMSWSSEVIRVSCSSTFEFGSRRRCIRFRRSHSPTACDIGALGGVFIFVGTQLRVCTLSIFLESIVGSRPKSTAHWLKPLAAILLGSDCCRVFEARVLFSVTKSGQTLARNELELPL